MKTIPTVSIRQVLEASATAEEAVLSACVVGPEYFVRNSEDVLVADVEYTGTEMQLPLPDMTASDTVDESSIEVVLKDVKTVVGTLNTPSVAGNVLTFSEQVVDLSANAGAARAAALSRDIAPGDVVASGTWTATVLAVAPDSVALTDPNEAVVAVAAGSPATNNGASIIDTINDLGLTLSSPDGNLVPLNTIFASFTLTCTTPGACDGSGDWTDAPEFDVTNCSISGVTATAATSIDGSDASKLNVLLSVGDQDITFVINGESNAVVNVDDNLAFLFTQSYSPVVPDVVAADTESFSYDSTSALTLYIDIVAASSNPNAPIVSVVDTMGRTYPAAFAENASTSDDSDGLTVITGAGDVSDFAINLSGFVAGTRLTVTFPAQANTVAHNVVVNKVPTSALSTVTIYGLLESSILYKYSEYPVANYTYADGVLTLVEGATVLVNGVDTVISEADVHVGYRSLRNASAPALTILNSVTEALARFDDVTEQNPIGCAAYHACLAAAGTPVYVLTTQGDSAADYASALELIQNEQNAWCVVPATTNDDVTAVVSSFVASQGTSSGGTCRKTAWLSMDMNDEYRLITASATVSVYADSTGGYRLVNFAAGGLTAAGVTAGDKFRIGYGVADSGAASYSEYTVASVLNDNQMVLVAGPAVAYPAATTSQVWRVASKADYKARYENKAAQYASRLTKLTFPPRLTSDSQGEVSGAMLCAALAGLKSSLPAHQPMYGLSVPGFSAAYTASMPKFYATDFQDIADSGVFVVAPVGTSSVAVLASVTTDGSSVETSQEQITSNLDYLTFGLASIVSQYKGVANMTETAFTALAAQLTAKAKKYMSANEYGVKIGPPLLTFEITDGPRADDVAADKLILVLSLGLPRAMNDIDVTIYA